MPYGKEPARPRRKRKRGEHRRERPRGDWVQYGVTAAQVLTAIANFVEAIRR